MPTKRLRPNGTWEFVIKNKAMLPKPWSRTFDTEEEGDRYCAQVEALLSRGVLPKDLVDGTKTRDRYECLAHVIRAYLDEGGDMTEDDRKSLRLTMSRTGDTRLKDLNYEWASAWVTDMKRVYNIAPSTIRHHVGALRRNLDWASREGTPELVVNPLRMLPRNYSAYSEADKRDLEARGLTGRENVERDRRLLPGEELKIRAVFEGLDRHKAAIECFFDLALESAMRMSEMHTLEVSQVKLSERTIFLDRTKNGDKRQVPITSVAARVLESYIKQASEGAGGMKGFSFGKGLLFPWWPGDRDERGKVVVKVRRQTSSEVSKLYRRIFDAAGAFDLHFHDLRHEATSRLFERTRLSDVQISKITGHRDFKMLRRYANLRATDLARELW